MRWSSFQYLLREGFRSIWHKRFMAAASIGVLVSCLLMTGGAYLTFVNIDNIFNWVYEQNVVVAYVDDEYTSVQTETLGVQIENITNVAAVEFLSKDDTLNRLQDSLPESLFQSLQGENNPLQDSYIVTFRDLAKFDATLMQLEALDRGERCELQRRLGRHPHPSAPSGAHRGRLDHCGALAGIPVHYLQHH